MNKRVNQRFDEPAVDGPDYVALVIEWEQTAIPDAIEDQVTIPTTKPSSTWNMIVDKAQPVIDKVQPMIDKMQHKVQPVVTRIAHAPAKWKAAGAVGVLALAGWGIHRLRAA
jgi:hypothetical protein